MTWTGKLYGPTGFFASAEGFTSKKALLTAVVREYAGKFSAVRVMSPGRDTTIYDEQEARAYIAPTSRQNRAKPRSNPVTTTKNKVKEAAGLRTKFRTTAGVKDIATRKVTRAAHHTDPVQLEIGEVLAIEYLVKDKGRKGQAFRHDFAKKSAPLLTSSHDGHQLYFVGGRYHFKTNGINDV